MEQVRKTRLLAEKCVADISAAYHNFNWQDETIYGNWLAQTYFYVRHATRLLSFAASRCQIDQELLHQSMLQGLKEEGGHELLALNDIKALGMSLEQFSELPETAAYRQTLYYNIDTHGPVALTGYFLPLEGLAARYLCHKLNPIISAHSPKATSFLRVHCHLDVGHFDSGLASLDDLRPEELSVVSDALILSTKLYISLVEAVGSPAGSFKLKTA